MVARLSTFFFVIFISSPRTRRHAVEHVFILVSSFRIWISLLDVTVPPIVLFFRMLEHCEPWITLTNLKIDVCLILISKWDEKGWVVCRMCYFRGVEFKKCLHVNKLLSILIRAAGVRTNLSPDPRSVAMMPEN